MAHSDAHARLAWKRFGEVVREARVRRGWLNQDELARAAGVSKRAVGQIERGAGGKRLRPTRVAMDVATALGWLPGSVDRVLHGEDPIVPSPAAAEAPPHEEQRETLDDIVADIRVTRELSRRQKRLIIDLIEEMRNGPPNENDEP